MTVERILRDSRPLEAASMRVARRAAAAVRSAITRGLASGRRPDVEKILVAELRQPLVRALVTGHVTGQRRARLLAREAGATALGLDAFDPLLKVLLAQKKVNINALQKKYDTQALKVLKGSSAKIDKKLREVVSDLISSGAHVKDAVAEMGDAFDALGISPRSEGELETIFRTQLQIAQNAGRWQEDQEEEIDEILWGYKYVTVGDDRVRPEHAALDGTTLPKDDPFWQTYWPPNGWNCRCQAIPLFEKRKVVKPGKVDGEVPEPDEGFDFNAGEVFAMSRVVSLAFDPDQPRDETGKWTDGGGGGGTLPTKSAMTLVKSLGGSTGAKLYEKGGQQYVVKHGNSPAHVKSEAKANELYELMGVKVPSTQLYEEGGETYMVSKFVEAAEVQDQATIRQLARANFVADAVLGNWDVTGAGMDNMILGKDGKLYRIDNGGALEYRAQGTPKGTAWNAEAKEIDTMRAPHTLAGKTFAGITDENIQHQLNALNAKLAGKHDQLPDMVKARLNTLNERFLLKHEQTHYETPVKSPDIYKADFEDKPAAKPASPSAKEPDSGKFTDAGVKLKNPAANAHQIAKAYEMYKAGAGHNKIAAETGLTPKQSATIVHKIKHGKQKVDEGLAAAFDKLKHVPAAKVEVKAKGAPKAAPQPKPGAPPKYTPPAVAAVQKVDKHAGGEWPMLHGETRYMDKAGRETLESSHGAYTKKLQEEAKALDPTHNLSSPWKSIKRYTGSMFSEMNAKLRHQPDLSKHPDLKAMQEAIKGAPKPPPPSVTWRGISSDAAKDFAGVNVGDELQLKGFQSSSIDPSFGLNKGVEALEIVPRAGVYVEPMTSVPNEYEWLLPHGASYKVMGYYWHNTGYMKKRVWQLEMLDEGQ